MSPVRIVIADDHEVVRKGLRSLLEEQHDVEIVGEASNGREAVDKVAVLKPDVVVLDIGMPELNGLEATRQIVKATPRTEVLILTVFETEEVIREVLRAGARGYVLKSDAGRLLVSAIEAVSAHKPFFTSRVSELVLAGFLSGESRPESDSSGLPLTPREREVLQLLAEGKTNKDVAAALGIGLKTVETHRMNLMSKLGLHSVVDLVRYAIRNGIVAA
ncbi:MAG: response regulator transcription factor [Deltaproteobacteria bacterium]|nr:MAG: response regulator transcription factor [Deltaproteobacteria bacterium]